MSDGRSELANKQRNATERGGTSDERTSGRADERMGRRVDEQTGGRVDERATRWVDKQTSRRADWRTGIGANQRASGQAESFFISCFLSLRADSATFDYDLSRKKCELMKIIGLSR